MGIATGLTKERMLEIEGESVVSGAVDAGGNLILTKHNGDVMDAGHVRGDPTVLLGVTDTSSVDMQLTGEGIPSEPWNLRANVLAIPEAVFTTGQLEASYRGGGPAKVWVGGVLSSVALKWLTPYIPNESRDVRLIKTLGQWFISGQVYDNTVILEPSVSFGMYDFLQGTYGFSAIPRATRLSSGLVVLAGLFRAISGTPVSGTVITNLPVGYRPEFDTYLTVEQGNLARAVIVKPNGDVIVAGSWSSAQYVSLDSINFWASGVATWIPIGTAGSSWGANFETNTAWNATYGVPSFWKDPFGFVWLNGLARIKTTTTTDDTPLVNLPVGYRADMMQHIRTVGSEIFAGVGSFPASGLTWKTGSTGSVGNWIGLSGIMFATAEARANNPWRAQGGLSNSWVDYAGAGTYSDLQYVRRQDGLVVMSGLYGGGTIGQKAAGMIERETWPRDGGKIFPTIANGARARVDISRSDEPSSVGPGALMFIDGSNTWFSMDSVRYLP